MMSDQDRIKFLSLPVDVRNILSMDSAFQDKKILEKNSDLSTEVRKAGNELFKQQTHNEVIHRKILFYYNKSIALAPKNTESLALGYSNRSVMLMHLQFYKESLIDIDKAYAITNSEELKNKLENRRKECLVLLSNSSVAQSSLQKSVENLSLHDHEDQNDECSIFFKPIVPSKVLPAASDAVTLNYNETFGRHLIATRDIKPGELIIKEKGYIVYPNTDQLYLICSHCLQFPWNIVPCDHCVYAVYCSENCKKEAWEEYHDEECSILPFFDAINVFKENIMDVMATTRLLIKAIKKEGLDNVLNEAKISENKENTLSELLYNGVLDNSKFRSYCNLKGNGNNYFEHFEIAAVNLLFRHTNLIRQNKHQLDITPHEVTVLLELKDLFTNLKDILVTNAIMDKEDIPCHCLNAFECSKNCYTRRGILFCSCSSLVNHSCSPNVEKTSVSGGTVTYYSMAPIKKGQQICETYGTIFATEKARRQQLLKDNFLFACKCIACEENWPTYSDVNICRDPKTDHIMIGTIRNCPLTQEDLASEGFNTYLKKKMEKSEVDIETLKHAIALTEWVYEHYEKGMPFIMSLTYKAYIMYAIQKLFEEKRIIPAHCRS